MMLWLMKNEVISVFGFVVKCLWGKSMIKIYGEVWDMGECFWFFFFEGFIVVKVFYYLLEGFKSWI